MEQPREGNAVPHLGDEVTESPARCGCLSQPPLCLGTGIVLIEFCHIYVYYIYIYIYICVCVCEYGLVVLAHCPVLGSGFGAVGPRDRLDRRGQGTEESRDQREAQAPPCTEHGPSIAMADVVRESIQVAGVT